jgi:hypothetical protein
MNRITTAVYTKEFREEATTSSCRPMPANWLANKNLGERSPAHRLSPRGIWRIEPNAWVGVTSGFGFLRTLATRQALQHKARG